MNLETNDSTAQQSQASGSTPKTPLTFYGALHGLRSFWPDLALTTITFRILAFVVLMPLVSVLFRMLIATSGTSVVSDVDIIFYFLHPIGCLCFVVVAALRLAILALEQSALLGIIAARQNGQRLEVIGAIRFAVSKAWPVFRVTARMIVLGLLTIVPFLAIAATTYFTLLRQYDINYYLEERPPVFFAAVAIGGVLLVALMCVLLRLLTLWYFALPIVLFEPVSPARTLQISRQRAVGNSRTILKWIAGWFLAMSVVNAIALSSIGAFGRLLIPDAESSLRLFQMAVGTTLLLWLITDLLLNLLSTLAFAAGLFHLYQQSDGSNLTVSPSVIIPTATENVEIHISPRRLLSAAIIGIVVSVAGGAMALNSIHLDDHVEIMAHRGASASAPENTMAAFRQAIKDGADWIELDVQETADGEVVVFHDSDFMKLANKNLKIWEATMADLKEIDIGSWFSPEFQSERVPTLAEVLTECRGKIQVNIELKYYGHDNQLEQRVVDIVESLNMSSSIVAMSLKIDGVRKLKSLRPNWKVGLLMSVAAGNLQKIDADFLAVNGAFSIDQIVRTAHQSEKDVYVWTVNDALTMSKMMSRGVDGILTDRPALAKAVLEQRAQMSPPERLLLELAGILGATPEFHEQ
jgi:glycerophosphoryl diester phosphodiesterase